ncbi:hypothetical protein [Streptomyces fradiae]|uniref:hypothetical protein n=2 Tax=Streptomyces fradiae TaxID=1906 RepID=UPI00368FEAD9
MNSALGRRFESCRRSAVASGGWEDALSMALGGRYALTDAACDGDRGLGSLHGPQQEPAEALRVRLPSRRYRVQSLTVAPDPDTEFRLERLLPE